MMNGKELLLEIRSVMTLRPENMALIIIENEN